MNKNDIINLLSKLHPGDLKKLMQYVKWVKMRRAVNNVFYFNAHWVQGKKFKAHWVGKHS